MRVIYVIKSNYLNSWTLKVPYSGCGEIRNCQFPESSADALSSKISLRLAQRSAWVPAWNNPSGLCRL